METLIGLYIEQNRFLVKLKSTIFGRKRFPNSNSLIFKICTSTFVFYQVDNKQFILFIVFLWENDL